MPAGISYREIVCGKFGVRDCVRMRGEVGTCVCVSCVLGGVVYVS